MSCPINILIDESIFVYAKRGGHARHTELIRFLNLSDKKNPKRKFNLVTTKVSKMRLGMPWFYHLSRSLMGFTKIEGFDKRSRRRLAALVHVGNAYSIPSRWYCYFLFLIPFHRERCLMDLHMFANEAKVKELKTASKAMNANEVIPLESCKIAQIAYEKMLPIFSFNTDFKFFCDLPNKPKQYVEYLDPETFLLHLDEYR